MSVGHDEYWSGARSAPTCRRRATPACTSRSSAATRSTGRRATSRASTARARRTARSSATRKARSARTPAAASATRCPACGPGCGATAARRPTPAERRLHCPRTRCRARSAGTAPMGAIQVPDAYKNLRFWRNTAVASARARGRRHARRGHARLRVGLRSSTARSYPRGAHPALEHARSTARRITSRSTAHASGALVFGAGTVQWSWGLDSHHDRGSDRARPEHAAGDGEPVRRHGRAARDASRRASWPRHASSDAHAALVDDRLSGRRRLGAQRQPVTITRHRRRTPAAASWPASRCRSTAARPGSRPTGRRAGPTAWTPATHRARSTLESRGYDDSGQPRDPRRRRVAAERSTEPRAARPARAPCSGRATRPRGRPEPPTAAPSKSA